MQLRDPESMIKDEGENQDNVMSGSPRIESTSRKRERCQMPLRDLTRYGLRSAYLVVRRATGNFTQSCFGEVLEEEAEFG